MDVRVAKRCAEGLAPVLLDDWLQAPFDFGERFVPGGVLPPLVGADTRAGEAIWVFVKLFERRPFRADEALGVRVVHVAADAHHLVALGGDLKAATRLAQRARSLVGDYLI